MKHLLFALFTFCCFIIVKAQNINPNPLLTQDATLQKFWVDSLYQQMTLEEKIGQLFMVDVFSKEPRKDIKELITKYHIGGIIYSKGNPIKQAKQTNHYQSLSTYPLLIAMDAEWGLAMRLDSTYAFPWNMTLGAIQDNSVVKKVAKQIAKHNKRLGVHINFAPVVDINTNPKNPIIGNRSFGEDKYNVVEKSRVFIEAFDEIGILSCAKHFPGHGDTDKDSHKTLPSLLFSKERLDSIELYPFKKLINSKLSSIMVAHLHVPALESSNKLPTSLSQNVVNNLIKDSLQFKGLVFTDALNMKGASNFEKPGEIDLQAFMAGNDILLISENVPLAIEKLKKAIRDNKISEARLARSVKKILMAKYKVGLHQYKPILLEGLTKDLNSSENDAIYMEAISSAITVVKNNENILPFQDLSSKKIAYLKMGKDNNDTFIEYLKRFDDIENINPNWLLNEKIEKLKEFDIVVIGHHTSTASPWKSYSFTEKELVALHEISLKIPVVLVNFSSPYALSKLKSYVNIKAIIQAYQNSDIAQSAAAQTLFGARSAKGKLPVSINKKYPVGSGFLYNDINRLAYGYSYNQGINPLLESKVDSVLHKAISQKMTPGGQIMIARNGVSIYHKSFGYHTYDKKQKVEWSDVYDVASLTKILATLPMFMLLEEEDKVSINDSLYQHLPSLSKTDKANINFKYMLSHYAQLTPWIPFHLSTLQHPEVYFSDKKQKGFTTQVANKKYVLDTYKDSIFNKIRMSKLRSKKEYKYSDLPFYLLQHIIENYYNKSLDSLVIQNYYDKMGITKMRYKPREYFNHKSIIPTENDTLWRKQLVKGYVHDQGAALLGGVGGHAGLFANANAVTKFMQMYLNKGVYANIRFLESSTIDKFNTCYFCDEDVRRGVGFDKPQLEDVGPTCGCLSMTSFGHSGFTGTYAWADPEEKIVYVFLSNRIHPDMNNKKLIEEGIRTEIQRIIYESIE